MPQRSKPGKADPEEPTPPIVPAATASTLFIGSLPRGPKGPTPVASLAGFEEIFGTQDPANPLAVSLRLYFENGGADARVLRLPKGSAPGELPNRQVAVQWGDLRRGGVTARILETSPEFRLLCVPGLDDLHAIGDLLDLCLTRRALLLLDAPEAWLTAGSLPAELAGRGSASAGVLYAPQVVLQEIGPTAAVGAVAGAYARTDALRGVWRSPAGLDLPLLGISGLTAEYDQRTADRLLGLAINPLLDFPRPPGPVIWGARTIAASRDTADSLRYVAVRRLLLYVENSIRSGMLWTVIENNSEPLWARVRRAVGDFLLGLFRAGAFAGSTPENAYFVRCDATTVTPADISVGRLPVEVGVAPLKPAEFVVLRIGLQAAAPDHA